MVNRILFVDNSISNSDWTKANAFDFPYLKTVEDFERQFNIPSEEPARSERLARLAVLPWVRVAPAPVREFLQGFQKQSLADVIKASFSGDRSAAGRYAANIRWQGNRKGDETKDDGRVSLSKQIEDVASELEGLKSFPELPSGNQGYLESYSQYFLTGKNKEFKVPGQPVMDAEKSVNDLGVRVFGDAGSRVVKSGFCTQKELDDAIAFQTRPPKIFMKSNLQRVLDGELSHPDVQAKLDAYNKSLVEAKTAKSALLKATKEYNAFMRTSGFNAKSRELYQERVNAKRRNTDAKLDIERAEMSLDIVVNILVNNGTLEVQKPLTPDVSQEAKKRFSEIHVAVGQEIKKIVGEHRPMAKEYPARVPFSAPAFIQEKQKEFVQEVASRFPLALATGLEKNFLRVELKSSVGGSYSKSGVRIITDLDDADTLTHETVHALTDFSESYRLIEQAALQRRIWGQSGDTTTPFAEKIRGKRQKEVGATKAMGRSMRGKYIIDDFVDPYQGRIYVDYFTEVLTVATEAVFGGGNEMRKSGRADRDLMATAVGILLTAEKNSD